MKTKEKSEKEVNLSKNEFVRALTVLTPIIFSIVLAMLFVYISITSTQTIIVLKHQLYQTNSTIINLTHSLAQANATTQALRSNLSQAQATINMQKAQITNLTNILNFNKSQIIFNKVISINSGNLNTVCNEFSCYSYPSVTNITLHFNFTYAGYIVINTTAPNTLYLALVQNYSRTWFDTNSSAVIGILNFSVRSITMPVLPGWAMLKLGYSNATVPYQAQFTITYHS